MALGCVLALLLVAAAMAAPNGGDDHDEDHADSPPVARASVSLLPRADRSWAAFDPATDTYRRDYVNPSRWFVRLDGCRSTGGYAIGERAHIGKYEWQLRALDGQHFAPVTVVTRHCRTAAPIPALGGWQYTLKVTAGVGRIDDTNPKTPASATCWWWRLVIRRRPVRATRIGKMSSVIAWQGVGRRSLRVAWSTAGRR
jgi:hypothetical protein